MRKELIEIEKIERYLLNKMNETEKTEFEQQINLNPELKAKVEAQKTVMDAVNRMALKQSTKNAHKSYKLQSLLTKLIVLLAVIAVAGFVTLKIMDSDTKNTQNESVLEQNISFLPENDSISNFSNKLLDEEIFRINTKQDTVIENQDGVIIYIPADAFDTQSENVDVLVQSALKAEDILYAGLSTTSNGNELETGGMFYVDAFENGKRVNLIKDLEVNVPTQNKVDGMQLYQGEKTKEGEINWVNPTVVKNNLTPIDILSLDFFPPTYNNTLTDWGYPKKEFKDSLYYSFAFEEEIINIEEVLEDDGEIISISKNEIYLSKYASEILYPSENRPLNQEISSEEYTLLTNMNYDFSTDKFRSDKWNFYQKGQKLFKANCAACHKPNQDFVGPALSGSNERWNDKDALYAFIQNSQKVIDDGNRYSNEIYEKWRSVMPPQNLSEKEIYFILFYCDLFLDQNSISLDLDDATDSISIQNRINPASIKTIWNTKFNNTNLATTQFEERLVWIHKSCNQKVLDLYINNLDKSLAEIDSMVIPLVSGEVKTKFIEFAKRNDGKVKVDDAATQKLSEYYQFKLKAEAKALVETQQNYWKEQTNKDNQQITAETQSNNRAIENKGEVFQKEYKKNLCKVYDELDYPMDCNRPPVAPNYYSVTVSQTGWNNIDKQVYMATVKRETTSFSYKGKTSSVTYNEWTGIVNNYQKFERINVYNIPLEFKSYVKLLGKNGTYTYKLNADLKYQTFILAWTENDLFFGKKDTKKGKNTFNLVKTTEKEFKTMLKASLNDIHNMSAELDFAVNAQKEVKRVKENIKRKALRLKIEPIVFPCDCGEEDSTSVFEAIQIVDDE